MAAMTVDKAAWDAELDQLYVAARNNDIVGIIQGLRRLVPEIYPRLPLQRRHPGQFPPHAAGCVG